MSAAPVTGIPYQPVTIVDAKSGEILYVYNAIVDLNLSQVYPTNPVKSPQLADVTLPVGDHGVDWSTPLVFPGLRTGERLRRTTTLPPRAAAGMAL